MKLHSKVSAVALFAAATACAIGAVAGPAAAATQTFHDHLTFDLTGAVLACQGGNLTVTGGTLTESDEAVLDA